MSTAARQRTPATDALRAIQAPVRDRLEHVVREIARHAKRGSAVDRAGTPALADKRRDRHVRQDPAIECFIEIAHRALGKVDHTAGQQRAHVVDLENDAFIARGNERKTGPITPSEAHAAKGRAKVDLDGRRPAVRLIRLA